MTAALRVTILGCGSSGGVPRLGGRWGACDPSNPKNTRRRCALLVEKQVEDATTTVLIDAGPDMRAQLLDAGASTLDGVLITHEHADHIHGLDDLRQIAFIRRDRVPVFTSRRCADALEARFGYMLRTPEGSLYPPILDMTVIEDRASVDGPAGPVEARAFSVPHGPNMSALGFRIGPLAYLPDVSEMSGAAWETVAGAQIWIVDALRYEPHITHSHLGQTLDWIARAGVDEAIITNMHLDLDYDRVAAETPDNVRPAYDGMTLTLPL